MTKKGAVYGAEQEALIWPWLKIALIHSYKHEDIMGLSASSDMSVCVWMCVINTCSLLFFFSLFRVCERTCVQAWFYHVQLPSPPSQLKMPHCESPSRAITHNARPFLNNFINILCASSNRKVASQTQMPLNFLFQQRRRDTINLLECDTGWG